MIKKYYNDSTIRKGIISSLIGTIFFIYLLEPFIKLLSNGMLIVGNFFSNTFIDGLYREMSKGRIDYSFLIIEMFFIASIMFLFSFSFIILFTKSKRKPENDSENTIENDSSELNENKKKKRKIPKFILTSWTIIFGLSMTFIIVMANIKVNTIINYNQKVKIITPYIDMQKKNLFESKFASMNSKFDFDNIMNEIEKIAEENNLELPEIDYSNLY
jgi:uncharacterized membrane protein